MGVGMDDGDDEPGLLGQDVLYYFFESGMVKIAFNVISIKLHDVDTF